MSILFYCILVIVVYRSGPTIDVSASTSKSNLYPMPSIAHYIKGDSATKTPPLLSSPREQRKSFLRASPSDRLPARRHTTIWTFVQSPVAEGTPKSTLGLGTNPSAENTKRQQHEPSANHVQQNGSQSKN